MKNPNMLDLEWTDFHRTVSDSLKNLRYEKVFLNVTLAFDEGEPIEANRLMLCISSPFFRRVLYNNYHSHPLMYLKGIKSENMNKILDFIYNGEVSIPEYKLQHFLNDAGDLEIKGLVENISITTQNNDIDETNIKTEDKSDTEKEIDGNGSDMTEKNTNNVHEKSGGTNDDTLCMEANSEPIHFQNDSSQYESCIDQQESVDDLLDGDYSDESEESSEEDQVIDFANTNIYNELGVHSGSKGFVCNQCGKSFNRPQHLKSHLEIHTESIQECPICRKVLKTKNSLQSHMSYMHPNRLGKRDSLPLRIIQCPVCFKTLKGKSSALKSHMARKHPESIKKASTKFGCGSCQKKFHTKEIQQTHSRYCQGPSEGNQD